MRHLLPFALLSVKRQTAHNFEHLILDDGSTDGTWEYLSKLDFPWLRIFRNNRKLGLAACRNRLLDAAKGELVSILDADDMLTRNKLSSHAPLFKDPRVVVVYGKAIVLNLKKGLYHLAESPPANFKPSWDLITPYYAVHSATTWRKSAIVKVGGYTPEYSIVEDADLYLKVGEVGRQEYLPKLSALKRVFPHNEFRSSLDSRKAQELSHKVLSSAILRRYGIAYNRPNLTTIFGS